MTSLPSVAGKSFWKLGGLTPRQLSRGVFGEINANNVFGRAAELAFYFLFALFLLIFLMMTLFGLFASRSGEPQTDLLSYFADFLPPTAFHLLRGVAAEIAARASHGKLAFGVVSALWFMSNTISSTISLLNAAYHVRETRSWFKARAIALVLSLVISVLLLAALFMVLAGSHFVDWLGAGLGLDPLVVLVGKAMRWPTAIFFVALSCSLIYRYGPDLKQRRRWRWFTPGAAFGAFIWLVASLDFRMYLHYFDNYWVSYGYRQNDSTHEQTKSRWEIENQASMTPRTATASSISLHHEKNSVLLNYLITVLALTIERLYHLRYLHRGTHAPRSAAQLCRLLWVSLSCSRAVNSS